MSQFGRYIFTSRFQWTRSKVSTAYHHTDLVSHLFALKQRRWGTKRGKRKQKGERR